MERRGRSIGDARATSNQRNAPADPNHPLLPFTSVCRFLLPVHPLFRFLSFCFFLIFFFIIATWLSLPPTQHKRLRVSTTSSSSCAIPRRGAKGTYPLGPKAMITPLRHQPSSCILRFLHTHPATSNLVSNGNHIESNEIDRKAFQLYMYIYIYMYLRIHFFIFHRSCPMAPSGKTKRLFCFFDMVQWCV